MGPWRYAAMGLWGHGDGATGPWGHGGYGAMALWGHGAMGLIGMGLSAVLFDSFKEIIRVVHRLDLAHNYITEVPEQIGAMVTSWSFQ